jgi:hypothetical protein
LKNNRKKPWYFKLIFSNHSIFINFYLQLFCKEAKREVNVLLITTLIILLFCGFIYVANLLCKTWSRELLLMSISSHGSASLKNRNKS